MPQNEHATYVFEEFVLDGATRTFKANGETIHLPAKEFDTLLYFVENRGRVLSKDEMMAAIWDDTFVEEGNLAQYVSRLRKVLNTNGRSYIQTLPKKGYRFDAEVTVAGGETPPRKSARSWTWIAGLVMAVAAIVGIAFFFARTAVKPLAKKLAIDEPIVLTDGKQDDDVVEWTADNHIRFYRSVSPRRFEGWIMNLDGSDPHREMSGLKDMITAVWSPDGKKAFFMKDGNSKTTFLANADGSNEIPLPMLVGNSDWSPDGTKFVYETKVEDNTELFLYTLATKENFNLTHNKNFDADPTFSPDGNTIAFVSDRDGDPEIYTMDLTGGNVRRMTNHPAFDHFPAITPDGTQMLFLSNRDSENTELFVRNLNDETPPVRVGNLNGILGTRSKTWSPDGTQMVFSSDINGKDRIFLMNVEPYKPELVIADPSCDLQVPSISPDGSKLVYQARLADRRIEIRVTDIATQLTKAVFKSEADVPQTFFAEPKWSPDGADIVFSSRSSGNPDIYSMASDGSGLRRLTDDPLPDLSPVYSADGTEIFFVRDIYGKTRLFKMKQGGSEVGSLTQKEGYETSPAISPDGSTIIFSGDRQDRRSQGLDIFAASLTDLNNEKILASRAAHDVMSVFSADGRRIAFVSASDGNRQIYVMNSDGSGLFRLSRNKADDASPSFSKDGRSIYFSSNREGKFAIYRVDLPQ